MSRVVETFPTAARPAAASFLEGNIYAAQSYGLAKRGDLAHANTAIGRAEVEYRRAMATAPALTADGNRALGSLYHGQRDVIHRDCDAKAALERYLSLKPDAADKSQIQRKLDDLRC